MMKNQKGFSATVLLLVLVTIGVIGGVGWYVYTSKYTSTKALDNASKENTPVVTNTQKQTQEYKVPEGFSVYENKESGFKFAYPNAYGSFSLISSDSPNESILQSTKPSPAYLEGSTEAFTITILKDVSTPFYTLKYGPKVKFENGELKVVEVNPADEVNTVGSSYKGWLQHQDVVKQVNGLTVYVIKGGDEGSMYYKYAFLSNGQVVIISLPEFYDGTSLCAAESCKANDKTAYDNLNSSVIESLARTQ
jgi:hypothetical protein